MSVARPGKLTAEVQAEICRHLREGLFRRAAAGLVGIPEQTVSLWFNRGAGETRGRYRDFFDAVNRAEAEFMEDASRKIVDSASSNPKHLQWLLSRRFPELYGRRDNVTPENPEDKAAEQAAVRELLMDRLAKFLPEEQVPAEEAVPPEPPSEAPNAEQ